MLKATRSQRTLASAAELRGVGFFHGADVSVRFCPAELDTGIVFVRTDLPDRPKVPARLDNVVPSQRRTVVRRGTATVEMIEHVMAALAGLQIDNCVVEIDAPECPGCDGSSRMIVEVLDRAGALEQRGLRETLVLEQSLCVRQGDGFLAAHPNPGAQATLSYHLDYGEGAAIAPQSYCTSVSPESFRKQIASSRTFLLQAEADALRAAGFGARTTPADLLIFGQDGVVGNALRYPDECARHKILDMIGDLALLGVDLQGFVVAHRSGHLTNAALGRRLLESARTKARDPAESLPVLPDGSLDIRGIMSLLPHRYPFLLIDRVLELEPPRRVVALKNVSANEPFFSGHWPGQPIMPGVLVIEGMAQAAGVLIAASIERAGRVALIASIDDVKLRRPILPGDQICFDVAGHRIKNNAAYVSGVARIGDQVAAEAKLRFVIVDAMRASGTPPGNSQEQSLAGLGSSEARR
jgi:UDP-3-O-[3-hydroxymyristoyl] N-acetylglucosamine deacetylase/3-hydroxyacyl-[acyl-carrier-protein] dehydratase